MINSKSKFSHLEPAQIDEVFALNAEYLADSDPSRVNLGIGVYRTDQGDPWPLSSVAAAEKRLADGGLLSRHDYLQIRGDPAFLDQARPLIFGNCGKESDDESTDQARIASLQTISGTGANHLGALFLSKYGNARRVWVSDPTWGNHLTIWDLVGAEVKTYPYFDATNKAFNFDGTMECLEANARSGDVLLLHACAHNPTGADPTKDQWKAIARLCERKSLYPFFDLAYQGFASGNLDEDAWAIRYFFNETSVSEFCVAQSFSKNFGLYGQRAGALHMVLSERSTQLRAIVLSNMCHLIRGEFSMAPRGGTDLVKEVLSDSQLRQNWLLDLKKMANRMKSMRQALYSELVQLGTPGTWEHVTSQVSPYPVWPCQYLN